MKTFCYVFFSVILFFGMVQPVTSEAQNNPFSPTFGTDIPIFDYVDCYNADSKVCVADNGWIYVCSLVEAPGVDYQAWRVWRSINDGETFDWLFDWAYYTTDWRLSDVDMAVTGNDPSNIRVYIAEATNTGSVVAHDPYVRITRWDADGTYIDEPYYYVWGTPTDYVTGVSIATDYRSPGTGGSPHAVAIAYTGRQFGTNWLCYIYSLDGGNTFIPQNLFSNTDATEFGKVSLSLGGTSTFNWGRYLVAFEYNKTVDLGDIGVMMNYMDNVGSSWTNPVNVNPYPGLSRMPSVVMMDNMSTSPANTNVLPVLITYEDWYYGSTDIDVYINSLLDTYVVNGQATIADFSTTLITPYTGNQRGPSLSFDKYWDNMLMLYADGDALIYQYSFIDNLLPAPGWAIFPNFRDITTPFSWDPRTSLDINPTIAQVCMTWTEQDVDATQNVYFDAEWSVVGIDNAPAANTNNFTLYPNPASDNVHLLIHQEGIFELTIYDLRGSEILFQQVKGGNNVIDLTGFKSGLYTARVIGGKMNKTMKLSVR